MVSVLFDKSIMHEFTDESMTARRTCEYVTLYQSIIINKQTAADEMRNSCKTF